MAPKIGLVNQQLQPPPKTPNCRTSMTSPDNSKHYISPIQYTGARSEAHSRLLKVLKAMPNTHLMQEEANYLRFECRTPTFKFTDDVEFYLPEDQSVIHMRSASRIGYSDWGTNAKRLEGIRKAFQAAT